MKRELELAKKLLESKGYEVSKKSRRLKESISSKFNTEEESTDYETLKDFREYVESNPDDWGNEENFADPDEEGVITKEEGFREMLEMINKIKSWLGVPEDKIYITNDGPIFRYLDGLLSKRFSSDSRVQLIDEAVFREDQGIGDYSYNLSLYKTSDNDKFVSLSVEGYEEFYYI